MIKVLRNAYKSDLRTKQSKKGSLNNKNHREGTLVENWENTDEILIGV